MRYDDNSLRMLTDEVSKRLSGDRFTHTIGVSKMAQKLALVFSLDATVATAAALLHDITKEYSYEEGLSLLREGGISLDKEDLDTPSILHSFTAEVVIKRDFPDFSEILRSAAWIAKGLAGTAGNVNELLTLSKENPIEIPPVL